MKLCSKRALKRIAIGLGLLIGLALVVNGVLAWYAQYRWNQLVADLRAVGEPASIADLAPQPIPPADNAANYIQQLTGELATFWKDYEKFESTPAGEEYDRARLNRGFPNAEQLAAMSKVLDDHAGILPVLIKATQCREYASLLNFQLPAPKFLESLISHQNIGTIRGVFNYLYWQAAAMIAEGKVNEATELAIRMLRLATLCSNEPTIMQYLLSIAMRDYAYEVINAALRAGPISPDLRRDLDAVLAEQENRTPLQQALRSERAFAISQLEEQSGRIPAFLRWSITNWQLNMIGIFDAALTTAAIPPGQLQWGWNAQSQRPIAPAPMTQSAPSNPLAASQVAVLESETRNLMISRCLRVLNAIEAEHQRTGTEINRVEELSLPREAITDPISQKPLRLKKTDRGWVIYSVWWNGVDDNGRFNYRNGDWGIGPPGYPIERE